MTYNTPNSARDHRKSTEPESHQMAKVLFFLSSSSDRLVQNCVTLSQWFWHKTAAFYTEQFTIPSLFNNSEVSGDGLNQSLKNYDFISDAIFKNVHMHSNHLATKQLFFKIVELQIWLCAWRQGESLASIVDSVFEQSLVDVTRCRDSRSAKCGEAR